jgi:hypothetical protein
MTREELVKLVLTMKGNGCTQETIAKAAGVSTTCVTKITTGRTYRDVLIELPRFVNGKPCLLGSDYFNAKQKAIKKKEQIVKTVLKYAGVKTYGEIGKMIDPPIGEQHARGIAFGVAYANILPELPRLLAIVQSQQCKDCRLSIEEDGKIACSLGIPESNASQCGSFFPS